MVEMSSSKPPPHRPDRARCDALMRRYVDGDEAAFEALHPMLVRSIRPTISFYLADPDDVDEVVQVALIRVHEARARFDGSRSVVPWARRIARNVAVDHLRRARRFVRDDGLLQRLRDDGPLPREPSPAESRERRIESVRRAIDALPDSTRAIVQRHKLRGEPLKDIAAQLGLGYTATRVRAHRGYGRLVELLSARGDASLRAE
jgi:RNA polymerase sigma-70 factor (ECF subfamily)